MEKAKHYSRWVLAAALLGGPQRALYAQGTAFTYQGRLNANGSAATGGYDFRFRVASDLNGTSYVGNPCMVNGVPVTNGLFTTSLDFGVGIFGGADRWLAIEVKTNGAASLQR